MRSRLDLELVMEDHHLKVYDHTEYDSPLPEECKHLLLRSFIKDNVNYDKEDLCAEPTKIEVDLNDTDWRFWETDVEEDGLYYYREILIPDEEHAHQRELYYTKDGDNIVIHLGTDPTNDFEKIFNAVVEGAPLNCMWYDGYTFTLSDLVSCYVKQESELLKDFARKCAKGCVDNSNIESMLFIIYSAIVVIDYLLQSDDYYRAQDLLERISGCSSLCGYKIKENKCNCGRTL